MKHKITIEPSQSQITIEMRSVCGVQRAYPVCEHALLFAALCRSKTLQEQDLHIIQQLGYTVIGLVTLEQGVSND